MKLKGIILDADICIKLGGIERVPNALYNVITQIAGVSYSRSL